MDLDLMSSEFEINVLGQLKYFLCWQINQRSNKIFAPQTKIVRNLVKIFDLDDAKYGKTPMSITLKLIKHDVGTIVKHSCTIL